MLASQPQVLLLYSLLEKMMNPAKGNTSLLIFSLLLVCPICTSLDTITPDQPLKDGDGQLLLSTQKTFALGLFSVGSSSHCYVGIWYNLITEQTVVWEIGRASCRERV